MSRCKTCEGTGGAECPRCDGKGRIAGGVLSTSQRCSHCNGSGKVKCGVCNGTGKS